MNVALIRFTSMLTAATLAVCGFFIVRPPDAPTPAGLSHAGGAAASSLRNAPRYHWQRAYALATTSTAAPPIAVEDAWGAGKWAGIIVGVALLGLSVYLIAKIGAA